MNTTLRPFPVLVVLVSLVSAQQDPRQARWCDLDGDGRQDVLQLGAPEGLVVLRNLGEGGFVRATSDLGLSGISASDLALADVTEDGRLDLLVVGPSGALRLFLARGAGGDGEGTVFEERTAGSGLEGIRGARRARWHDVDGDGRADLTLERFDGTAAFCRGLGGTRFEEVLLDLAPAPTRADALVPARVTLPLEATTDGIDAVGESGADGSPPSSSTTGAPHGPRSPRGSSAAPSPVEPLGFPPPAPRTGVVALGPHQACAHALEDAAGTGCLQASSTPELGMLYPLSEELFVDAATGRVGIGTSAPTETLEVDGRVKVGGDLTLEGSDGSIQGLVENAPELLLRDAGGGDVARLFVSSGRGLFQLFDSAGSRRVQLDAQADLADTARLALKAQNGNTVFELSADGGLGGGSFRVREGDGSIAHMFAGAELRLFDADGVETISLDRIDAKMGLGTGTRSVDAALHVQADGSRVAKFDRFTSDGELVAWARNDVVVGNVTVSGGVVSYNAFTGSHYAWSEEEPEVGALLALTGVNRALADEEAGEIVYGVTPVQRANDSACLGAYVTTTTVGDGARATPVRLVSAVGNGELWVVDTGVDLEPGDLLVSSDVRGCAMRDDPARFRVGHVVARLAERVRWSEVEPSADGLRRARVSVLFDAFERAPDLAEELAELRGLLQDVLEQRSGGTPR